MTTNLLYTTRAKLLLRDILASKRMSPVQATVKRAIDVIVSFIALVILSPLLLSIALAVRFTSPGLILFR